MHISSREKKKSRIFFPDYYFNFNNSQLITRISACAGIRPPLDVIILTLFSSNLPQKWLESWLRWHAGLLHILTSEKVILVISLNCSKIFLCLCFAKCNCIYRDVDSNKVCVARLFLIIFETIARVHARYIRWNVNRWMILYKSWSVNIQIYL